MLQAVESFQMQQQQLASQCPTATHSSPDQQQRPLSAPSFQSGPSSTPLLLETTVEAGPISKPIASAGSALPCSAAAGTEAVSSEDGQATCCQPSGADTHPLIPLMAPALDAAAANKPSSSTSLPAAPAPVIIPDIVVYTPVGPFVSPAEHCQGVQSSPHVQSSSTLILTPSHHNSMSNNSSTGIGSKSSKNCNEIETPVAESIPFTPPAPPVSSSAPSTAIQQPFSSPSSILPYPRPITDTISDAAVSSSADAREGCVKKQDRAAAATTPSSTILQQQQQQQMVAAACSAADRERSHNTGSLLSQQQKQQQQQPHFPVSDSSSRNSFVATADPFQMLTASEPSALRTSLAGSSSSSSSCMSALVSDSNSSSLTMMANLDVRNASEGLATATAGLKSDTPVGSVVEEEGGRPGGGFSTNSRLQLPVLALSPSPHPPLLTQQQSPFPASSCLSETPESPAPVFKDPAELTGVLIPEIPHWPAAPLSLNSIQVTGGGNSDVSMTSYSSSHTPRNVTPLGGECSVTPETAFEATQKVEALLSGQSTPYRISGGGSTPSAGSKSPTSNYPPLVVAYLRNSKLRKLEVTGAFDCTPNVFYVPLFTDVSLSKFTFLRSSSQALCMSVLFIHSKDSKCYLSAH